MPAPDTDTSQFDLLLLKLKRLPKKPITILGLDPGETTGYCVMSTGASETAFTTGQLKTSTIEDAIPYMKGFLQDRVIDVIVCEDYRVYSWKSDQHKWANLHTPQLIGCIKTMAYLHDTPIHLQMAVEAKDFCTDEKLQKWGMYQEGQRHARDAIRHATSYLLFAKLPKDFT